VNQCINLLKHFPPHVPILSPYHVKLVTFDVIFLLLFFKVMCRHNYGVVEKFLIATVREGLKLHSCHTLLEIVFGDMTLWMFDTYIKLQLDFFSWTLWTFCQMVALIWCIKKYTGLYAGGLAVSSWHCLRFLIEVIPNWPQTTCLWQYCFSTSVPDV